VIEKPEAHLPAKDLGGLDVESLLLGSSTGFGANTRGFCITQMERPPKKPKQKNSNLLQALEVGVAIFLE